MFLTSTICYTRGLIRNYAIFEAARINMLEASWTPTNINKSWLFVSQTIIAIIYIIRKFKA